MKEQEEESEEAGLFPSVDSISLVSSNCKCVLRS